MQKTPVRSLIQEDPTCFGVTQPGCHNYWTCALEPRSHSYWTHVLQLLHFEHPRAVLRSKRSQQDEKATHCDQRVALGAMKTQHSKMKQINKKIPLFLYQLQSNLALKLLVLWKAPRWRRSRTGKTLSPPQIHQKSI